VVPVDGEEEPAAGLERGHVPARAPRGEPHRRGVHPLQLRADRLVEVDEYEHGRLGRRPSRAALGQRGWGPRDRRRDRTLSGHRRRHAAAPCVCALVRVRLSVFTFFYFLDLLICCFLFCGLLYACGQ